MIQESQLLISRFPGESEIRTDMSSAFEAKRAVLLIV